MKPSKTATAITAAIALILIALTAASLYFLDYALSRDEERLDIEKAFGRQKEEYPWTAAWVDSIRSTGALRDTFSVNHGNVRIHTWYLPAQRPAARTAILIHGYRSNAIEMMQLGYMYHHDLGWNILLPDLEAHGLSGGQTIQMGWLDRLNIYDWMEIAGDVFPSDTILVHGVSMGAATTMCISGMELDEKVMGFVEDCGYTSVYDEFKGELKNQFGLPAFPLMPYTSFICALRYEWSFQEASPLNEVARCDRPMLFIHGDADTYVPTEMVHPLYEAKPGRKTLWLAQGSAHANAYKDHPEEYTATVEEFIKGL